MTPEEVEDEFDLIDINHGGQVRGRDGYNLKCQ